MVKLVAIFGLACACTKARVVTFEVTPTQVCKDSTAKLVWEVVGRATLRTAHGGDAGTPEPITTTGTRDVKVSETTTFTIMALDADRASQQWMGEKTVTVTSPGADPRRVLTTCDASGRCAGTFTVAADATVTVTQLSSPAATSKGATSPATVCVTHGTLKEACVTPDRPLAVTESANGDWVLSTTVPAHAPASPPPALTVMLQLGCH
jgi:hypothetical protein